jgi:hypothetical protein
MRYASALLVRCAAAEAGLATRARVSSQTVANAATDASLTKCVTVAAGLSTRLTGHVADDPTSDTCAMGS